MVCTGEVDRRGFTLSRAPLWRLRLVHDLPRYLLAALALWGILASVRNAVDPPRPIILATDHRVAASDAGAEAFAVLFARRYLTWNAAEPLADERALEPFLGTSMEPDAGVVLPDHGEQQVGWAEVVQSREPLSDEHVYTIAAELEPGGLRYLTVPVLRLARGLLALGGYPAFVGAPATAPAHLPQGLVQVDDASLEVVVRRALSNYLAGAESELAADLTPTAEVTLPLAPLRAITVQRPYWAPGGGAVLATVQAEDTRGVRYTLSYELDVSAVQGRWEVSAVQTDPDA